jgi:predicted  nucleic acid-binding Zn-ribbon protein
MYFPLISRTDYDFLASLLKVSQTKVRNQFLKEELSMDVLRHKCSNYDEVRLNQVNSERLEECFAKYDKDRITIYLKLIVNNLIAEYMLEIATEHNSETKRNYRTKFRDINREIDKVRTLCELGDVKIEELSKEVATLSPLKERVSQLEDRLATKSSELENTNAALSELVEEAVAVATKGSAMEIDALKATCLAQEHKLTTHLEIISSLRETLVATDQRLAATEAELVETKQRLTATEAELVETKQRLAATETELVETKAELVETKAELVETKQRVAVTEQRLTKTEETVSQLVDKLSSLSVEHVDLAKEVNNEEDAVCVLPKIQAGITAKVMPIVNLLKVTEKGTVAYKARERQLEKWLTALIKCTQRCNEFIDASFELTILEAARDKYLTVPISAPSNPSALSQALRKHSRGFARFF